jgi:hypothetical protein
VRPTRRLSLGKQISQTIHDKLLRATVHTVITTAGLWLIIVTVCDYFLCLQGLSVSMCFLSEMFPFFVFLSHFPIYLAVFEIYFGN